MNSFQIWFRSCLLGFILGISVPFCFILLDLYQLGESFGFEQISFIIRSQYIYLFSFVFFPLVSVITFFLVFRSREMTKQLSEQRRKSEVNARLASVGELASGIGHEINNPLAIIKGNAGFLIRAIERQAKATGKPVSLLSTRLDKIIKASDRIEAIVSGLRTMARVQVEDQALDARKSIKEVCNMLREMFRNDGVQLTESICPEDCFFIGDYGRFQQILVNLITNARDAVVGNEKEGLIQVKVQTADKQIYVEIIDNGSGIPDKDLPRIFDTFYTSKPVGKGTGLGLSIVHSLVKEMKGEIEVDSTLGKGTTFVLRFPLHQKLAAA